MPQSLSWTRGAAPPTGKSTEEGANLSREHVVAPPQSIGDQLDQTPEGKDRQKMDLASFAQVAKAISI